MLKRIPLLGKLSALIFSLVLLILYINFLFGKIDRISANTNLHIILIIITAFILCIGGACLFIYFFVKRPFDKLLYGMNKLAEKDFNFRFEDDESDEFYQITSTFNDMAARIEFILTELKKNKDYLEGILESTADIIVTVSSTDKIMTINSGAERTLGYMRQEVIGKPIEMFFADPEQRKIAINKLKLSDSVVNFETTFLTKNGENREVLLSISRLRNSTGEVIATIGISKDITEEKRLQNLLIQTQRLAAIGEVFAGIQHSLKNMLNSCMGGAYMVKLGLSKDNRRLLEEGWGIVQEGISRMTAVSLAMLRYVKEWKPNFKWAEIPKIMSQIELVIKQSAKDKGINLQVEIPPEFPQVLCDARMVHSVIMDIISNAIDACVWKEYQEDETPEISFGASLESGNQYVTIKIADNGCGMSDEVKKKIFNPFFSMKSKAGTGLGLSVSSRMIEAHDGRLEVDSEPNIGTTFQIILPIDRSNKKEVKLNGKKSFSYR
jgi:PAS domain S-box-containing protein